MKSPLTQKALAALEQIDSDQGTEGITQRMIDRLWGERLIDWDKEQRKYVLTFNGRCDLTMARMIERIKKGEPA